MSRYRKKIPKKIINQTDVVIIDKTISTDPPSPKRYKDKKKYKTQTQNHVTCYKNMARSKLVKEGCITSQSLKYVERILNQMISRSSVDVTRRSMMSTFSRQCPEATLYITNDDQCKYYIMYASGDMITKHFQIDHIVDIYFNTKVKKYEVVAQSEFSIKTNDIENWEDV